MNIAVIGCGVYSLSVSKRLSKNPNNNIKIWSENKDIVKSYKKTNKVESIYKSEKFNNNIVITNDYNECLKDADIIFLMTSMKYLKDTVIDIKTYYKKNIPIIIGTKGIDTKSLKFASNIVKTTLKTNNIAVIAGPSFAIDILNDEIFALTVASKKRKIYKLLTTLLNKDNNCVLEYTRDLLSIQLSSTLKNIYAIGSGILSGLKLPESNTSIYLTKVLKEIEEILYMLNDDYYSMFKFGFIGDTIMTCTDNKSRNYTYGTKLCSKSKKTALNYLEKTTVEGVQSIDAVIDLLKKRHIKCPIINCINNIINGDKPNTLIDLLLK